MDHLEEHILVCLSSAPSNEKIVSTDEGLVVYLHARAHDGEANEALVEALSEYFEVSKTMIDIRRGRKSRKKLVEIIGM